jgi:hypothetical protein
MPIFAATQHFYRHEFAFNPMKFEDLNGLEELIRVRRPDWRGFSAQNL